jgi:NTE family protein
MFDAAPKWESARRDIRGETGVEQVEVGDVQPEEGMALCLSGGGYRAMLFHLGSLWRLNEVGLLPQLKRVSSVSGGSITAAVLGLAWHRLDFNQCGVSRRFDQEIVQPISKMASQTIDIGCIARSVTGPGGAGRALAGMYRKHLFGARTLQDLPDENGPRFVFNASNLQSGALWRFSRPYARDYRVGSIPSPRLDLAVAVAASSAFPPFLSPVILNVDEHAYEPNSGLDLQYPPFTTRVQLTDGGVYDNLGLETIWKRYCTVLVSDGGGHMSCEPSPNSDWLRHARRVLDLVDNQVRSLRKRELIDSFKAAPADPDHRTGAYWGIRTDIADYPVSDPLPCPHSATLKLAQLPTRLAAVDRTTQARLINWGYAVCDAALRAHVDPNLSRPGGFPIPAAGVGG